MFAWHSLSCHILFMPCILFEEPFVLSPIVSLVVLRNICRYFFWGWQLKHVGRLLFCLGISKPLSLRTGLILLYILGLDVISFSISMTLLFFCYWYKKKKKKNLGVKMRNFYFFLLISFQILYMFLPDISVRCTLIEYAYIWLRFYVWYMLSFLLHLNDK
jgi:hypothetical protein